MVLYERQPQRVYLSIMRNRTRCEKIKGEVSVAIEVVIRFDRHQL